MDPHHTSLTQDWSQIKLSKLSYITSMSGYIQYSKVSMYKKYKYISLHHVQVYHFPIEKPGDVNCASRSRQQYASINCRRFICKSGTLNHLTNHLTSRQSPNCKLHMPQNGTQSKICFAPQHCLVKTKLMCETKNHNTVLLVKHSCCRFSVFHKERTFRSSIF